MRQILVSLLLASTFIHGWTQCESNQVEVFMNIYTDAWPYETYWQLVPAGNDCGEGVIAEGGNINVNCEGLAADDGPLGYPANTMVTTDPICLNIGESYDLIFLDSWGDGGLVFEIYQNGALTVLFTGLGFGNSVNFIAGVSNTPLYDQPCGAEFITLDSEIVLDNTYALAGFGEIAPEGGGCGNYGQWCEGTSTRSVWAYFIAEEDQGYEITTCGSLQGFDTQIALYKSENCNGFENFELISANDDTGIPCATSDIYSSRLFVSCLEPGATYYIQVDGYFNASGEVALGLYSYDGTPELVASVSAINCPVNKGDTGNGAIYPYIIGEGINFSAQWTGPNGFSSNEPNLTGLNAGVYEVEITSACGIQYNDSYEIFEPSFWNVFLSSNPPSCGASFDGELSVDVSGATPPYQINWNGPGGATYSGNTISGLDDGEYTGMIIDANECPYPLGFQLNAVNDFEFEVQQEYVLCDDGSIEIELTPQYSYFWFDGSAGNVYPINGEDWNIGNNSILVTVSNDQGCNDVVAISFVVDDCTFVDESTRNGLMCYPNPSEGQITIQFPSVGPWRLEIFDNTGKLVRTELTSAEASFVYLDLFSSGQYWLRASFGNQVYQSGFIVK